MLAVTADVDERNRFARLERGFHVMNEAAVRAVANVKCTPPNEPVFAALRIDVGLIGRDGVFRRGVELIVTRPEIKLVREVLRFDEISRRVPWSFLALVLEIKRDFR